MKTAYLLNPADERLENPKRRKARRSKKSGRKGGYYRSKAWMAKIRKMAKRGRRKSRKANKPGFYGSARRKGKGFKKAHRRTVYTYTKNRPSRRKHRKSSRRQNAGGNGGGAGGLINYPEVLPLRLPIPGIVGKIVNGTIQGIVAGGVVFGGYVVSGIIVDMIVGKQNEVASKGEFVGKWGRPLAFSAIAGVLGGVVAMAAPKGKKATWAILAAAGPAIRAFAGLYVNLIGDKLGPDALLAAAGLGDYLQVGDLYEAGMGQGPEITDTWGDNEGEMMDDYLQVGDLYEAGMGTRDVFAPA
jgi:hypothetical protein